MLIIVIIALLIASIALVITLFDNTDPNYEHKATVSIFVFSISLLALVICVLFYNGEIKSEHSDIEVTSITLGVS